MRSLVLAVLAAAAVAVPGPADALPSGLFAYCDTNTVLPTSSDRGVAITAQAYVFFEPAIATWVGCDVRLDGVVLGSAQMAAPGVATVATGNTRLYWWESAEVCLNAYALYGDGTKIERPEECWPLPVD